MPSTEPADAAPAARLDPSLRVVLHGRARVDAGAGSVDLDTRQAAVLAWLAAHGPTPRARLAGLLWPDATEARARANLRQRLSTLRRRAAGLVVDARDVLALAPGVAVEPAPDGTAWLDAFEYDAEGEFAAWLEGERESQRGRRRRATLAEVRALVHRGDLDRALAAADRLLESDRESEEAYRALMEVYYLRGDRAEAIAVWDRCRDMLRTLYGVRPSAATEQLGRTVLDAAGATVLPSPAPVPIPVTLLRPPRLIGRSGVLPAMVAAWRQGQAVLVSGDAGIGKSRVLAEFAAAVGPGASVAARPGDAALPYASLARLALAAIERFLPTFDADDAARTPVGRLMPQIAAARGWPEPAPLRTAYERAAALRQVAALFDAALAAGAAVFVFDDLQFADAASVEALLTLCEREAPPAAALPGRLALGSRREEQTPASRALVDALAATRRLHRVELAALDDAESLELLKSLGLDALDVDVLAPRLHRQVGGNPAFLLESMKLVAALGGAGTRGDEPLPVPSGIQLVVERRVALLSPSARHVAELAAIAGESFDAAMAARALGRPLVELGELLRELEWRQVLFGRHFVHDIVAGAVRHAIPATVAEFLHRFVAEELERRRAEPALVAAHWRACGEAGRAGDAYVAAAERSRRAGRAAESAAQLDAAAECFAAAGRASARFLALRDRLRLTLAPDYSKTSRLQVERLAAAATNEEERLIAERERIALAADHLHADDLAAAEAGWRRAHELGLAALAFEFAHPIAWLLASRDGVARAREVVNASRDHVLASGDLDVEARFYTVLSGVAGFGDRIGEAIEEGERALAVLRRAQDSIELLPVFANMALFRSWRGEFAAADALLVEARALRDRIHGRGSSVLLDLHAGAARRDLGDFAGALALLEPARATLAAQVADDAALFTDLVICENHLAQLWLLIGDVERARAALATDDRAVDLRFRLRRAALALRAFRLEGRPDAATAIALAARVRAGVADSPPGFHRALAEIELARRLPARERERAASRLEKTPAVRERPGLRLQVLVLRAAARRELGRADGALADGREAMAIEAAGCLPFDLDRLAAWNAVVDVAEGDPALASEAKARAGRWLETVRFPDAAAAARFADFHAASRRRFSS